MRDDDLKDLPHYDRSLNLLNAEGSDKVVDLFSLIDSSGI